MEEGFEETLTVNRLGVPKVLRKNLKTTNVIEPVLAFVSQKKDEVDYWKNRIRNSGVWQRQIRVYTVNEKTNDYTNKYLANR